MTKEEMLAKVSAKTEEYNTEKDIQALIDKLKASLPKLRYTHETLVALDTSIEWDRFISSPVTNTDIKDEDDGIIGMNACDPEFGLYYRYKEGSRAPTMGKLCIDFVKEELCLCYDGLHSTIPINEISIDTMFPHIESYHYQVLLEKFEKLVNAIDPYIESITQFVESH